MKTALQQAIEKISLYINDAPQQTRERGLLLAIKSEVELFLEAEKSQIIQAHTQGQAFIIHYTSNLTVGYCDATENEIVKALSGEDNDVNAKEYYSSTFKTQAK